MIQKSHDDRMLWAQFDALEMGTGWEDTDILKPQIMIESVYGDSHPGSYHLNQMVEQAVYGVYQCGGKPAKYYATDICDGCAQGHDGMNVVLASREAIANMVEVHASAVPWDGMILSSSCDKSIPAHLKAAARMDIPAIFMPGGSMRPGPNMTTSLVAGDISLRQKRKDAITPQEVRDYKLTGCPSVGACTFLGTASTMQCMAEALGLTLRRGARSGYHARPAPVFALCRPQDHGAGRKADHAVQDPDPRSVQKRYHRAFCHRRLDQRHHPSPVYRKRARL